MEFKEQYKHPMWQKRRLEVLGKSDFMCQECGDEEKQLHVHHRQYFKGRMVWEYSDDELICLCGPCHEAAHAKKDQLIGLLQSTYDYDMVIGFLRGVKTEAGETVFLDNHEQAVGYSLAVGRDVQKLILSLDPGGSITHDPYSKITSGSCDA